MGMASEDILARVQRHPSVARQHIRGHQLGLPEAPHKISFQSIRLVCTGLGIKCAPVGERQSKGNCGRPLALDLLGNQLLLQQLVPRHGLWFHFHLFTEDAICRLSAMVHPGRVYSLDEAVTLQ